MLSHIFLKEFFYFNSSISIVKINCVYVSVIFVQSKSSNYLRHWKLHILLLPECNVPNVLANLLFVFKVI